MKKKNGSIYTICHTENIFCNAKTYRTHWNYGHHFVLTQEISGTF